MSFFRKNKKPTKLVLAFNGNPPPIYKPTINRPLTQEELARRFQQNMRLDNNTKAPLRVPKGIKFKGK